MSLPQFLKSDDIANEICNNLKKLKFKEESEFEEALSSELSRVQNSRLQKLNYDAPVACVLSGAIFQQFSP